MARIYYHQEKLAGQALHSSVIDLQSFDKLFAQSEQNLFEFSAPEPVGFFKKIFGQSSAKAQFKFIRFSRDSFAYNTSEGNFYLPQALIFYDVDDANFPGEFYFIARIAEQLELRQCRAGEGVQWFQIPDLHEAVTDSAIVNKIEQSFVTLKQEVERSFKEKSANPQINSEIADDGVTDDLEELDQAQKDAFTAIAELALPKHPQKALVIEHIQQLKQADEDGFFTPLTELIESLWKDNIRLFVSMD